MHTVNIDRDTFVAFIEAGIENAPDLKDGEVAALREVGRTANEVLVGSFESDDCQGGCPLTLAGLYAGPNTLPDRAVDFYRGFDRAVDRHKPTWYADKLVI